MQGSVAQARKRRHHDHEAGAAGPSRAQVDQLELSLNGPLASLAGRSYSDAGADQDISSPKHQPATSSAQARLTSHLEDEAHGTHLEVPLVSAFCDASNLDALHV